MKKNLIILVVMLLSISVFGQQSMFKALFMFNFAKYIEWPNMENKNEFTIGVYGNDEIVGELNKLASARKINNKPIVVKTIKSLNEAENFNIFYIPNSKSGNLAQVIAHFKNAPTLIITDKPSLCSKGSHINYVNVDGKMKFEINKTKITGQGLKVDPKLVTLGISVN